MCHSQPVESKFSSDNDDIHVTSSGKVFKGLKARLRARIFMSFENPGGTARILLKLASKNLPADITD